MIKLKLHIFCQECYRGDVVFINSSYWVQEVYILSTCEVNLEHLVKVVFAMFLYSKVIVFPIVINEYWEACEILLDYANILFLLRLSAH